MSGLPFDLDDPPDEPPAGVSQLMAWRLAVRLHRDHAPAVADPARPLVCRACDDPWPCHPRRLAERGLVAACRRGRGDRLPDADQWPGSRDFDECGTTRPVGS